MNHLLNPEQIDLLMKCFSDETVEMATLVRKVEPGEDVFNPNQPKVILDSNRGCNLFQPCSNTLYKGL